MNTQFLHPEQKFKLVWGAENVIRQSVVLADGVDTDDLHDGLYLTPVGDGKWEIANASAPAYPMLEMKFQYDGKAIGDGVTIARGTVPAVVSEYDYSAGDGVNFPEAPEKNQKLKVVNGVLAPVDMDGSEDHLAVAVVEEVYADRIVVTKLY